MTKTKQIEVQGRIITILNELDGDFISLTDMLQSKRW